MNDERSARWNLPLLQPGQAQKEADHNETVVLLDVLTHPAAIALGVNVPPADPATGQCWIVGDAPVGAWSGHAAAIAGWTAGGWRFLLPRAGMTVWSIGDALAARYDGSTWIVGDVPATRVIIAGHQVIGARQPAIADPVGGTTSDGEARAAITAILGALRAHGLVAG